MVAAQFPPLKGLRNTSNQMRFHYTNFEKLPLLRFWCNETSFVAGVVEAELLPFLVFHYSIFFPVSFFYFEKVLGEGAFGVVLEVNLERLGRVSAKIVKNEFVNPLEVTEWKNMAHPNVLRLLQTIDTFEDTLVFITDLMVTDLYRRLESKEFRHSTTAMDVCRRYGRQALQGLEYLHRQGLCHLDFRAENILIADDDRAVVADFSGFCRLNVTTSYIPLPPFLRPPETMTPDWNVEPAPVDLWTSGLLLAHLFLGERFFSAVKCNPHSGTIKGIKNYCDVLESETFVKKHLKKNFPKSPMRRTEQLINIIGKFLKKKPEERMPLEHALNDEFFIEDFRRLLKKKSSVPKAEGEKFWIRGMARLRNTCRRK